MINQVSSSHYKLGTVIQLQMRLIIGFLWLFTWNLHELDIIYRSYKITVDQKRLYSLPFCAIFFYFSTNIVFIAFMKRHYFFYLLQLFSLLINKRFGVYCCCIYNNTAANTIAGRVFVLLSIFPFGIVDVGLFIVFRHWFYLWRRLFPITLLFICVRHTK